jgi:integrase
VKTIGERAKLPFRVHAHMLRHACGYALANAGHDTRLIQDWLGHRAIQHAVYGVKPDAIQGSVALI